MKCGGLRTENMSGRRAKLVLLAVKTAVAAGLLAWVGSQAHWNDYVVSADGDSSVLLSGPGDGEGNAYRVREGRLWWKSVRELPAEAIRPIAGTDQLVRPGMATGLRNARWPVLAGAMAMGFAPLLLIALRWRRLMAAAGMDLPYAHIVRLTFLGSFFNMAMPGMVGGDLVKAYYAARRVGRTPVVLVSLFADRLSGLTALVLLACTAVAVAWFGGLVDRAELRVPALLAAIAAAGVAAMVALLLSARLRRALHLQKLYERLPIARHIAAAGQAARAYRDAPSVMAGVLGIALLGHLAWITTVILVGRSLSIATPWPRYFIYVPLIYIVGVVPLVPGGWGLLEKCYVLLFASATVGPTAALAMALLSRGVQLTCGLSGLAVLAATGALPSPRAIRAELDSTGEAGGPYNG